MVRRKLISHIILKVVTIKIIKLWVCKMHVVFGPLFTVSFRTSEYFGTELQPAKHLLENLAN